MGIRKRGKTWWIDFTTPSGQRVRQSAQTTDKRAAQELHDRLRSESWRAGKLGEIAGRWFEEGAARWLSEATHKASIDDDAAKVQFFRQHFAGKRLDEITRDAVDRLASPMNPATANRHVAWIRAMLRKAEREWGWLDRAPAFKTYKEPKRRIRWLTPDEFSRLHAALPARYKDPAQFAVLTGLRQGNVIGLEWSQVDLDRKFAWVHPDQAKARRAIGVPLNGEAVALPAASATGPAARVWQPHTDHQQGVGARTEARGARGLPLARHPAHLGIVARSAGHTAPRAAGAWWLGVSGDGAAVRAPCAESLGAVRERCWHICVTAGGFVRHTEAASC